MRADVTRNPSLLATELERLADDPSDMVARAARVRLVECDPGATTLIANLRPVDPKDYAIDDDYADFRRLLARGDSAGFLDAWGKLPDRWKRELAPPGGAVGAPRAAPRFAEDR